MKLDSARSQLCGHEAVFRFRLNAWVYGPGGHLGDLHRLLMDPATQRVVGLGVRTGLILQRELYLPLEKIISASEEGVYVSLGANNLRKPVAMQPKPISEIPKLSLASAASDLNAPDTLDRRFKLSCKTPIAELQGDTVGHLRQVVVDAASGRVVEIVAESGWLRSRHWRLHVNWIRKITPAGVETELPRETIGSLPPFRGDREIRANILDAWFYDDRLRLNFLGAPLDVRVVEGIAFLEGFVPTRTMGRWVEEVARATAGVLEVHSAIVADDELAAKVAAYLQNDSHTGMLWPRVSSDMGVITLEGEVPDGETRVAASAVAGSVSGVRKVVNRLRPGREGAPRGPARGLTACSLLERIRS